jgi:hypothetical protein
MGAGRRNAQIDGWMKELGGSMDPRVDRRIEKIEE